MATLDNKAIRGTLPAVFRYIDAPDKNVPPDDLARVGAYIRGEHAVERLYSRGHNGCSHNPEVALQQFRACEALYRQRKGGAKESGLGEGKQPIVAEHFFLSFPDSEYVSYETQCEIADKLMASPLLRDFYGMSNRHWNTDNDHSHILVSNVSKDGTRKLGMNSQKRNALRKELDRICALDYGLSIIDSPPLRWNDPEHETFVRSMVGKVDVYVPADWQRLYDPKREFDAWMLNQIRAGTVKVAEGKSKNGRATQAKAYKRWVAEQEAFVRDRDKRAASESEQSIRIYEEEQKRRNLYLYYWRVEYRLRDRRGYYYPGTCIYYPDGSRKPALVLAIELALIAMGKKHLLVDFQNIKPMEDGQPNEQVFWNPNRELQALVDTYEYRDKHDVRTPRELALKIQTVGSDLAEVKQGLAYYEKVAASQPDDEFAAKKAAELAERKKELSRAYHELKFVQAHMDGYQAEVDRLLAPDKDDLTNVVDRAIALSQMQAVVREQQTQQERGK